MADSLSIVLGIISMIAFGIQNAMCKVPSTEMGYRRAVFFRGVFLSVLWLAALPFFLAQAVLSPLYIAIAFLISLIGYIPLASYYASLRTGKVGVVSPIANSAGMFAVLLSVFFFGETLGMLQLFSIALIIAGIVFISLNPKDLRNSHVLSYASGAHYALLSALLWGLVFFLFKIPVLVLGVVLTSFIIESGVTLSAALHMGLSGDSFALPGRKMLAYCLALAVVGLVGLFSYNLGVKISNVSIMAALTFSSPLVSTLYGRVFYGEALTRLQYAATAAIVAGVLLLSVS